MIREKVSPQTSSATRAEARAEVIVFAIGASTLGKVLVARSSAGVCAILMGSDRDELEADLAIRFPQARLAANEPAIDDDLVKVIRFVEEPAHGLCLPLDMRGTPFQRRMWKSFAPPRREGR
jgi:methylated-DNA-[protein]-cysteine S-methyltransferase/AraC family transcriptional regulator of adaptative response/methylated-DNA-[protein]-cysteine methyltransferase